MNWLTRIEHPLKISIGFFLKYSAWFVTGFFVINIQIKMNWRKSLKSISGNSILLLVSLHQNEFTDKCFRQEEEKCYEVSQDTDAGFAVSSLQPVLEDSEQENRNMITTEWIS